MHGCRLQAGRELLERPVHLRRGPRRLPHGVHRSVAGLGELWPVRDLLRRAWLRRRALRLRSTQPDVLRAVRRMRRSVERPRQLPGMRRGVRLGRVVHPRGLHGLESGRSRTPQRVLRTRSRRLSPTSVSATRPCARALPNHGARTPAAALLPPIGADDTAFMKTLECEQAQGSVVVDPGAGTEGLATTTVAPASIAGSVEGRRR